MSPRVFVPADDLMSETNRFSTLLLVVCPRLPVCLRVCTQWLNMNGRGAVRADVR